MWVTVTDDGRCEFSGGTTKILLRNILLLLYTYYSFVVDHHPLRLCVTTPDDARSPFRCFFSGRNVCNVFNIYSEYGLL